MATALQQQTSRTNGKNSHGPVTEEGKKIVSRNALKHGLTAKTIASATCLLSTEDQEEFSQLHLDLYNDLAPTNAIQRLLVDRIVLAQWKLQRIDWMEATTIEADRYEEDPATGEIIDKGLEQSFLLNLPKLTTLHRYEARLQREFRWCLKELETLKRTTLPNLKNHKQTQPDPKPPTPTIPEELTDAEFDRLCAAIPPGLIKNAKTNPIHHQIQQLNRQKLQKTPPDSNQ